MHIRTVIKRNGKSEEFDAAKLNKWAAWAADLCVDWSSIALEAYRKCVDKCSTDDLHTAMISACVDKETEEHLIMAGKLFIGKVYKEAFGGAEFIPTVKDMYTRMVAEGLWAPMNYTDEEFEKMQTIIKHRRDETASYSETKQICDKYAIFDRVDKIFKETPQFVYMRMAMQLSEHRFKKSRMKDVEKFYNYLSMKKINPPSPNLINLGTPKKQYASCCVITTNDTAASLAAADHIAYMMTCASAGIGHHIKSRSAGDKVRHGMIVHQGKLPYYKVAQASVLANLQANRGGALTMHFNLLDPELEDLMKLKNVQTVTEKRIKDIDYSFGYNLTFVKKALMNDDWMLVSYADAPDLYEAMYDADESKFVELYEKVLKNKRIPKKFMKARDIATTVLSEAYGTGRMYEHNCAELNRHTPFKEKIYSSNLCQEIALVTSGFRSVADLYSSEPDVPGEIGLCNLAAIIAGNVKPKEYEDVGYYALLMVDTVIEIMDYPFPHLKRTAQARRSAGIGITNLAYDLATKKLKYSTLEGKKYIHRLAELHSYSLHRASLRLAKEYGVCDWMHKTKYPDGWLPIDTANKFIDTIVNEPLHCDWETLRQEIIANGGIRHSVLEAHMPCESSALASGTTNGLYPIREIAVIKTSGINKIPFLAPRYESLKNDYEFAWDISHNDMAEVYAVVQKFTGQGISADFYLNMKADEDKKIGTKQILEEFAYRAKLGLKTRYYFNSGTSSTMSTLHTEEQDRGCAGGACSL